MHISTRLSVANGLGYQVSAITGDPVFQFAGVIDRPVPIAVRLVGDAVVVINGPEDAHQPTIDDVVDATVDEWAELAGHSG